MKVVLVKDVSKLGRRGQVVSVADGYGRNFLLPKGLALEATPANTRKFEGEQEAARKRDEREAAEAETAAARLEGLSVTIKAKAGEEGRLFGSVTAKDIAAGIKDVAKIDIDRRKIELDEPLKTLGVYRVTIRLSARVTRGITVNVVAQDQ